MRYEVFIEEVAAPEGLTAPTRLRFKHLDARALTGRVPTASEGWDFPGDQSRSGCGGTRR
jgi:hypothetical protein